MVQAISDNNINMVSMSSFMTPVGLLLTGIWAHFYLQSTMNYVGQKQLMIEPGKFSYKMWKDMPVTMYQSFTFFNLTNWHQVKSFGQRPRFVEVGPYVYKTVWSKSEIHFHDNERLVDFAERKQWHFQPDLSGGYEDDQIWTINTPLMTALALIQNAPVITRNVVSVVLDGLGEGAFIKRSIRHLLFEGYADLIVSVGPFFDKRFSYFNGKFAYLYNKNDSIDGRWTVETGVDDIAQLNKVLKFHNNLVNMTANVAADQKPQGLNELHPNCEYAWTLDGSTNGQLFSPVPATTHSAQKGRVSQEQRRSHQVKHRSTGGGSSPMPPPSSPNYQVSHQAAQSNSNGHYILYPSRNTYGQQRKMIAAHNSAINDDTTMPKNEQAYSDVAPDTSKSIFYPDLCRPIHLISTRPVMTPDNIRAIRYVIDPFVFMNSTQNPSNRCFEIAPKPPLANALTATLNSVTGGVANLGGNMASGITGVINPYHLTGAPSSHHHHQAIAPATHSVAANLLGNNQRLDAHARMSPVSGAAVAGDSMHNSSQKSGINGQSSSSSAMWDQQPNNILSNSPLSRLSRVRQAVSNFAQRVSSASSILPGVGNPFASLAARNAPDDNVPIVAGSSNTGTYANGGGPASPSGAPSGGSLAASGAGGSSDRWVTQFRTKWPEGVFSLSQCQLGAPIYASLPHFLDADEYYREQVDGMRPNRSLHEFYIDVESTLNSIPVAAKARLQLNVATPELRFRNLPNAMIPVLWQEVTFEIDKPVASMLYWWLTWSPFVYSALSIILLASGAMITLTSIAKCYKQHRKIKSKVDADNSNYNGSQDDDRSTTTNVVDRSLSSLFADHASRRSLSSVSTIVTNEQQAVRSHLPSISYDYNAIGNDSSNNGNSNTGSQCELVAANHSITCAGCIKACLAFQAAAAANNNNNNSINPTLASNNNNERRKIDDELPQRDNNNKSQQKQVTH